MLLEDNVSTNWFTNGVVRKVSSGGKLAFGKIGGSGTNR
jgi:hypothetical protein